MTISPINLGSTFTNTSGTSVLSGISSGINTQSVINSLVASQSAQVTTLNDKISVNNKQLSALSTLQQLLTQIQTATAQLSNPQSPDENSNIFASSSAQITSNTSQAASNFLTATAATDTAAGTYTISNISQLATATTQSTTTTFSSATSAVVVASGATSGEFNAGTINITGPKGSGSVTLNSGDTLNDVAADFNDKSTTTGISASVLQTSPGVYTLVFSSTTTGSSTLFDLSNHAATTVTSDPSGVLSEISFQTMTSGANGNEGQNASFELNGTTITRTTNTISDLISGVTLNLLQNTQDVSGASFTLQISPNTSNIQSAVDNFATAYNNFLTFYAQQTALNSSGTPASSAILYSDNTLRTVYNQLTSQVSSIVAGLPTDSDNQLTDIGLGFFNSAASSTAPAVSNMLSVDDTTLDSAINSNLSAVENIFGYNLTSSSSNLVSYQGPTSQTATNFTLTINSTSTPNTYTASGGDLTSPITLTASSLGTDGTALTAPSSSALAGLILIYTGNGSDSPISVTTTQGIAAQMNNFVTSALTANTGLIATDESGIQTSNTTLQTQITNVTTQVSNQRTELLQKFSALESAISEANSSLNYLNAQQSAASGG